MSQFFDLAGRTLLAIYAELGGVDRRRILGSYVMRNALLPICTAFNRRRSRSGRLHDEQTAWRSSSPQPSLLWPRTA